MKDDSRFQRPSRDSDYIGTAGEFRRTVFLMTTAIENRARKGQQVTRQDIESESRHARAVVIKERGDGMNTSADPRDDTRLEHNTIKYI